MNLNNKLKPVFLLVLLGLFGISPSAQEEQLIVIEDLNRPELRREIALIEKEIYAMFNENNENPSFNITCREIVYTGTHIPEQSCEPQFLLDARSDNATDVQFRTDTFSSTEEIIVFQKNNLEKLNLAMEALAKENPNFAQLVMILNKLNARLAQL